MPLGISWGPAERSNVAAPDRKCMSRDTVAAESAGGAAGTSISSSSEFSVSDIMRAGLQQCGQASDSFGKGMNSLRSGKWE